MSENKIDQNTNLKYDVEIKTNDLKESQAKTVMHIQTGLLNEFVQEGAFNELNKLLSKFTDEQLQNVLIQRNYLERVPLHIACLKGNLKIIKLLVENHQRLGISLDLIDQNKDTPFNLACSHGSYNIEKIYQIYALSADFPEFAQRLKNFLNQKHKLISYLINNGVDIQKSIVNGKMNPLHWAIYYGDFESGLEIFNSYPEIMFYKNERNFTPLETIFENKLVKVAKFASKSLVLSIIEIFLQKLLDKQNNQQVPTQNQDNFDQLIETFQKMILQQSANIDIDFNIERRLQQRKEKIQQFHQKYIHQEIQSTKKIFTNNLMKQLLPEKNLAKKQIGGLQKLLQKKLNEKQNKQSLVNRLNALSQQKKQQDPTNQFSKSIKDMNDDENYDSDQAEEFGTRRNLQLMDDDFEEFKRENANIEENIFVEETKNNPFDIGTKFAEVFAEQKIQSNLSIEKGSKVQDKDKSDLQNFDEDEDEDVSEDDESQTDFSTIKEKKQKKDKKQKKSKKKKKKKKKRHNKKDDSDNDSDDDKKSNQSLYIDSFQEEDLEDELEDFQIKAKEEQKESFPHMNIIETNKQQDNNNQNEETQVQHVRQWEQQYNIEKQGLQVKSQQPQQNAINIYDEKETLGLISKNKSLKFLHKLLVLLVRTELSSRAKMSYSKKNESYNMKLMRVLIEQFGVNPFYIAIKDYSAFHLACKKENYQMIDYFINQNFQYIGSQRKYNCNYQITKRRGRFLNTSIHVAAEENCKEIVKLLISKQKDIQYANFQNCFPLEMNQQQFYIKKNNKIIEDKDNELLEPQLLKLDLQDFSASFQVYQQYDYLIIYKLREQNIESSLMYNQLARLREKWKWDGKQIRIKYFEDFRQNEKKDFKICYFLIGFPLELIQKMADDQDMKIYNKSKQFIQTFEYSKKHKYEKFQDYHKHFLIERMLYTELDMFHLIKNNLVVSMIPLHQFSTRFLIQQNWQKEKYEIFFDFYKTRTELKDLRPLNSLASYYGCDYAFHISFTAQFTSFLVILFFIGLIIQIMDWAEGFTSLDFRFNFIYCICLIIWLFMTNKFWRRRENEYALVWNTIQYEKHDNVSLDYRGIYTIDTINQKITKINNIPSKTRRFLSDILLAIIGGGLIVAQFFIITQMQSDIKKMSEFEIKDKWKFENATLGRTILSASVGILNSVLIFVWTFIYNFVSQKLVVWENHKYESDNESSYISKSFLFQWVLAYINLFYYAFYLQSVDILATNFITLFFSKNILFLILNDFIPHMIFIIKKKLFLKKWIIKRKEEKIKRIKKYYPHLINESQTKFVKTKEELTEKEKRLLLKVEKTLISEEQVYINVIMPKPVNIDNLWLFFILQFGYIAYFSISFPIITIACIIMNIIHIFYTFYSFNNFMQRIKSKIAKDIGIWNAIVLIMIISAFFINVLILNYTTRASQIEVFKIQTREEFVSYYQKIYEIEHLVILFFIIVSFGISNKPTWVQQTIDQQKYREQFYIQKQKQEKVMMKNQILQELERERTI